MLLLDLVPFVRMCLAGKLANPDWVEDVTQEVLVSVHKSLQSYAGDRAFKPWLNAIIQFRRTDFLRSHYRGKKVKDARLQEVDTFGSNVTFTPHAGELKDMESALSTLPLKQKQIFMLLKIEGYSIKEVAVKMDMSESAVKVSAHRTSNKLKGILTEDV